MTTQSKHTPGPWLISSKGTIVVGDRTICDLNYPIFPIERPDELSANARLIAAAPELLEGCKEALRFLIHIEGRVGDMAWQHMHDILAEAIAKAEGGVEC